VDRSLPRTAIIGAAISGLTAGKMLKDYSTQQVDYFYYEHDVRTRELPAGLKRAQRPVRV
jgi:predicted NAD/FAD-binding protein